jgi:hypothetical protein
MTKLAHFFKDPASRMGVFYPQHYIIATFRTFAINEEAVHALRREGFGEDDMLALSGAKVIDYFEEFRATSGLWASIMEMLSRAFGTEQVFADDDVENARAGAGFLAIHCPKDADKSRIQALLTPLQPIAMHWYRTGGIEILV